jgi:hypothetical protein
MRSLPPPCNRWNSAAFGGWGDDESGEESSSGDGKLVAGEGVRIDLAGVGVLLS